jgi:hypothetical protein
MEQITEGRVRGYLLNDNNVTVTYSFTKSEKGYILESQDEPGWSREVLSIHVWLATVSQKSTFRFYVITALNTDGEEVPYCFYFKGEAYWPDEGHRRY